ncbi:MAG: hypothetical protein M0Z31_12505 [Clostridia bacterium]|nr:hypothetical protein [Clostridia bacterium]
MEKFLKIAMLSIVGLVIGAFSLGIVFGIDIDSKTGQVGNNLKLNNVPQSHNSSPGNHSGMNMGPGYVQQDPLMQQQMQYMQQNPNVQANMQGQMPGMNVQGNWNVQTNMQGMNMQGHNMNNMDMGMTMMNQGMNMGMDMMNRGMNMMGMPMM